MFVPVTVSFTGTTATLTFASLGEEVCRLTVSDALTDLGGNRLDGNGDLAAEGNWTADFVVVMVGFSAAVTYDSGGAGPFDVATGDFNADGEIDLAIANTSARPR